MGAILASAVAGAAKEYYDKYKGAKMDTKDVLATMAGGAFSMTITFKF